MPYPLSPGRFGGAWTKVGVKAQAHAETAWPLAGGRPDALLMLRGPVFHFQVAQISDTLEEERQRERAGNVW